MTRTFVVATIVGFGLSATVIATPAQAHDGAFFGGMLGGFAAGTVVGSAMAGPRYYYGPAPVYYGPPPGCFWQRQRVWMPGAGWMIRRVRVCY
jgi:hypothetical protein